MGIARLQVRWSRDNGLSEDDCINTWYATSGAGTVSDTDGNGLADALNTFYNTLSGIWAAYMSTTRTIKVFDMADVEPRVPVHQETYTPTAPTNEGLPSELAICLSFYRAAASGENQRRMRGRIYLGPVAQATLDAGGGTGDRRIASGTLSAIDAAYVTLSTDWSGVGGEYHHCVYSPTSDASSALIDSVFVVNNVYVDNSFDVVRRRSSKTTTRQVIVP